MELWKLFTEQVADNPVLFGEFHRYKYMYDIIGVNKTTTTATDHFLSG